MYNLNLKSTTLMSMLISLLSTDMIISTIEYLVVAHESTIVACITVSFGIDNQAQNIMH